MTELEIVEAYDKGEYLYKISIKCDPRKFKAKDIARIIAYSKITAKDGFVIINSIINFIK